MTQALNMPQYNWQLCLVATLVLVYNSHVGIVYLILRRYSLIYVYVQLLINTLENLEKKNLERILKKKFYILQITKTTLATYFLSQALKIASEFTIIFSDKSLLVSTCTTVLLALHATCTTVYLYLKEPWWPVRFNR